MNDRLKYRIYDKQEKIHIYNAGVWGNHFIAIDSDVPENYFDTFGGQENLFCGNDDNVCISLSDRFVPEQCTGLKAPKSYRHFGYDLLFENDVCKDNYGRLLQIVWCDNPDYSAQCLYKFKALTTTNFKYAELFSWYDRIGKYLEVEIIGTIHDPEYRAVMPILEEFAV